MSSTRNPFNLLPTYKTIVQNDTNNELLKKENTCPKQFCEAITHQSPQFPFGMLLIRLRMCPRGSCIKVLVTWVLLGDGGKLEIQDLVGGPLVIRSVPLKETRGFSSLFLNSFSWDVTFALSRALAMECCPSASLKQGHQAALEWEDKSNSPLKPWAQETFSFQDSIASGIVTVRRH